MEGSSHPYHLTIRKSTKISIFDLFLDQAGCHSCPQHRSPLNRTFPLSGALATTYLTHLGAWNHPPAPGPLSIQNWRLSKAPPAETHHAQPPSPSLSVSLRTLSNGPREWSWCLWCVQPLFPIPGLSSCLRLHKHQQSFHFLSLGQQFLEKNFSWRRKDALHSWYFLPNLLSLF